MIADEVMAWASGAPARGFAVDHWKVVPDLLVHGEGIGPPAICRWERSECRHHIAQHFQDKCSTED